MDEGWDSLRYRDLTRDGSDSNFHASGHGVSSVASSSAFCFPHLPTSKSDVHPQNNQNKTSLLLSHGRKSFQVQVEIRHHPHNNIRACFARWGWKLEVLGVWVECGCIGRCDVRKALGFGWMDGIHGRMGLEVTSWCRRERFGLGADKCPGRDSLYGYLYEREGAVRTKMASVCQARATYPASIPSIPLLYIPSRSSAPLPPSPIYNAVNPAPCACCACAPIACIRSPTFLFTAKNFATQRSMQTDSPFVRSASV